MRNTFSARTEQRQHINLSQHTYDIIAEDSFSFFGEINISGMINGIITGSIETSEASISIASGNYREKLAETIITEKKTTTLSETEISIINHCVNGYIKELIEKHKGSDKGVILKIRLRNEIYDELYPMDGSLWSEADYYATPGQYIKALCEDYASKTYYAREAIIFKEILDKLQPHIQNTGKQQILRINYVSGSGRHHRYNIKPLRISSKIEADYHYLICLSQNHGSDDTLWNQASYRISRITDVHPYAASYGSGKITDKQKKEFNEAIAKKGVAFLFTSTETFAIELTKEGVNKYNQLTHLRPSVTNKTMNRDGSGIFYFDCTEAQIRYYFFSFGKDAKIISHPTLAEEFKQSYIQASEKYD